jgi:hypothetical protein
MRIRNKVATTLICLSLAGCFKAGQKAPLVENKPNVKLVERYNEDVSRRLEGYQQDLFKAIEKQSASKVELKRYRIFEGAYLRNLEAKCKETHDNDLDSLHGEVIEWRTGVINEMNRVSLDVTNLITSLESEKMSMDTTEKDVGQPVISAENRGMLISIMRLSMNLRREVAEIGMGIVPAPECTRNEAMAAKASQKAEEPLPEHNHSRIASEDRFHTELESGLASEGVRPKSKAEEDIYGEGQGSEKTNEREILENRL